MKIQAQVTHLESKLSDLQASVQDILESHLERQSSIMSEHNKLLIELIERQKVENEEPREALEVKDNEIKERDYQIKEKEQQTQELQEGPHPVTNGQNGEETVTCSNMEIVKRSKIEKGFLFFL
jgi:hypothetical protein